MKMTEVRDMARELGIAKSVGVTKADLIREIQTREGNRPCFGTIEDYCDQYECCFREDCLS